MKKIYPHPHANSSVPKTPNPTILRDLLNENCQKIFNLFEEYAIEGYLIGGCVRDALLGIKSKDFDFACNKTPQELKKILSTHKDFQNFPLVESGIHFGTLGIQMGGQIFEITTFRQEGHYKDFRRPGKVRFCQKLQEDILRRDFSINALAYHPKKGIVDYVHGISDLKQKKLRCLGKPKDRFIEDALRVLRGVGFTLRFKLHVEKETLRGMKECASLLKNISKQRITLEWKKILLSLESFEQLQWAFENFGDIFNEVFEVGFSENVLNHLKNSPYSIPTHSPASHMEISKISKHTPFRGSFLLKSAFIFRNKMYMKFLEFSKKEGSKILDFLECFDDLNPIKLKLSNQHGILAHKTFPKVLEKSTQSMLRIQDLCKILCKKLSNNLSLESLEEYAIFLNNKDFSDALYLARKKPHRISHLNINGHDLKNLDFPPQEIGKLLNWVLQEVIEERVQNHKQTLLKLIKIRKKNLS